MARGTMHAQKPDDQRRRRNASSLGDGTVLVDDGKLRGPTLYKLTGRRDWPEAVVTWFDTWRRSPQAQIFEATDWSRLAMLALIVESYTNKPSAAALSEIRMNEERLGATVVDRMRARIRVEHDEEPDEGTEDADVIPFASTREDIAKRLKGGA